MDLASALPRLGGMARPNGVVIVSERYWAFSGVDGTLLEGQMPELPALVRRVPLLRGLAKLTLAFAPVMGRSGPTKRLERAGLLAALFLPFGLVLVSQAAALAAGFALTAVLFWLLFRGRTLALHGAEHRAIAAVEARNLEETSEGRHVRPASRFAAERTSPRSPHRSPSQPTRSGRSPWHCGRRSRSRCSRSP